MSKSKLAKIKKRVRDAFPDNDPDKILRALVPIVTWAVENQNTPDSSKKKAEEPKKKKAKPAVSTSSPEAEDEDWCCGGRVWIIPPEPCPDDDTHGKSSGQAKAKTRWGGKMHVLCNGCRKDHEKWKRTQAKAKKAEESN